MVSRRGLGRTLPRFKIALYKDRCKAVKADSGARLSSFGDRRAPPGDLPAVVRCMLSFVEAAGVSASDKAEGSE